MSDDAHGSATSNEVIVAQPHPVEAERQRGQIEPASMTPYDPYRFRSIDSSPTYGSGFSILDDDWIPIDSPWKAPEKESPSPLNDTNYYEQAEADDVIEQRESDVVTRKPVEEEASETTYNEE